jgi:hypothetical protein
MADLLLLNQGSPMNASVVSQAQIDEAAAKLIAIVSRGNGGHLFEARPVLESIGLGHMYVSVSLNVLKLAEQSCAALTKAAQLPTIFALVAKMAETAKVSLSFHLSDDNLKSFETHPKG